MIPSSQTAFPERVVTSTLNGNQKIVLASKVHRCDYVGGAEASGDNRRPAVEHPVPDFASALVSIVCRKKHFSLEEPLQFTESCRL